jgi:F0F1-type ATP synthase epsilon subunit
MKENSKSAKNSESGYWLYGDGTVRWGIALLRNEEAPIKVDEKVRLGSVDERIAYHQTVIAAKQKAEDDAKAKEKELEEKNAKALKK